MISVSGGGDRERPVIKDQTGIDCTRILFDIIDLEDINASGTLPIFQEVDAVVEYQLTCLK